MSLTKYAEFETLEVISVPKSAGHQRLARIRQAHRHQFQFTPRPGFIYVRSRAISSRINDNFDGFPAEEIKKAYRTFIGKPVFVNHKNSNHRRARGVIIDAALHEDTNPDGTPDTWAEVLMEVDAVRFPKLAEAVERGDIARTSMGTDVQYSICTACGNKAETPADYCAHIPKMKGMKIRRVNAASGAVEEVLIAEMCYGLGFFENSLLVEPPADPTAFVLGVDTVETMAKAASLHTADGRDPDRHDTQVTPVDRGAGGWRSECRGCGTVLKVHPTKEEAEQFASAHEREHTSSLHTAAEKGTPEYKGHYQRGWASGVRGTGLEAADARREPDAWYDGYMDAATGRPKWSLMHHPDAETAEKALDSGWTPPARGKKASLSTEAATCPQCSPEVPGLTILCRSHNFQRQQGYDFGSHNFPTNLSARGSAVASLMAEAGLDMEDQGYVDGYLGRPEQHNGDPDYAQMFDIGTKDRIQTAIYGYPPVLQELIDENATPEEKAALPKQAPAEQPKRHWWQRGSAVAALMAEANDEAYQTPPPPNGFTVGEAVNTEWGPGQVITSTGRTVTIALETGEEINIQNGVPGMDRLRAMNGKTATNAGDPLSDYNTLDGCEICGDSEHSTEDHRKRPEVWDDANRVARLASTITVSREDLVHRPNAIDVAYGEMHDAIKRQAYGEVKAPAKVDTLRAEACPVCGDDEGFNGAMCNVCGYAQPPEQFRDPDLSKAQEMDLRQDQQDEQDPLAPEVPAEAPQAPAEDLQCTNCGEVFSAEGDAATDTDSTDEEEAPEADPEHPDDPKDGDSKKADDPRDLSDMADLDDDDLLEDDEAEPKAKDPDQDAVDPKVDPMATGEGRVTPDGKTDPADDKALPGDDEIAPNMTCPVCGEGTLIPVDTDQGDTDLDEQADPTEAPPKKVPPKNSSRQSAGGYSKEMSRVPNPNPGQNPAQQRRSRIIAAIAEQQGVIEAQNRMLAAQQAQIHTLTRGIATLAIAAGAGRHEAFAGLVRQAGLTHLADSAQNPEGAPATTTEEAKQPQATDDVNNVGAAPAEVNKDVTPAAVTDVQNSNVAVNPPVLDNLQDVTAPVSGTDAPTPAAGDAAGTSTVTVGTPSQTSFDSTGPQWSTAAKGEQVERFTASLRLARLQIAAGLESGEDLTVAEKIASSGDSLVEITAAAKALASVQSKASAPVDPQRTRSLVPRAAARQPIQPSMQSQASAVVARPGEDEWGVGVDGL